MSNERLKPISTPLTLFLIGATGDLSKRKILKALFALYTQHLLPATFTIIGVARAPYTKDQFRDFVKKVVEPHDEASWNAFCKSLEYVRGDVSQASTFQTIAKLHDSLKICGNHLWYIATLPSLYIDVVGHLETTGLGRSSHCGWTKIMLEKPFGTDTQSSRDLDIALLRVFSEDQIYRIDHFLAKETVQNLLVFRFANGIFENLWNREFVDNVQVCASESIGIEGREAFYDATGTVRDVVQNHILQMIAVTLMEQPISLQPESIRSTRAQLLRQMGEIDPSNAVFGQYIKGAIEGQSVRGYRQEHGIPSHSQTETAVAFKLFVKNDRWKGVPIYVRAGKRLKETITEISIQFKEPSNPMFADIGMMQKPNILTLRIGPNEGVVVRFHVKKPGIHVNLEEVPMQFCYKTEFQMELVEAYVKLIYDAVEGDATLFPNADAIENSWHIVEPLLNQKSLSGFTLHDYAAGSWGPKTFDTLFENGKQSWIEPSTSACSVLRK